MGYLLGFSKKITPSLTIARINIIIPPIYLEGIQHKKELPLFNSKKSNVAFALLMMYSLLSFMGLGFPVEPEVFTIKYVLSYFQKSSTSFI